MKNGKMDVCRTSRSGEKLAGIEPSHCRPGSTEWVLQAGQELPGTEIRGFGGALTESAAWVLKEAGESLRNQVLKDYFSVEGAGYTLARIPMNSCDFALGNYCYSQNPQAGLSDFDVCHEDAMLFPLVYDAQNISGQQLKIMASPWSPPAWMKENGRMNGGTIKDEFMPLWAEYFVKFCQACETRGITLWAFTPQNEPEHDAPWDACVYQTGKMENFVGNYLGPALKTHCPQVKLFYFDHNKDNVKTWTDSAMHNPKVSRYLDGVAFHWYSGDQFENVRAIADSYPQLMLLNTEACQERGPHLGSWAVAHRYIHDILGDLKAGAHGWIDWNIVLDISGGPNHVNNLCSAPVMIDLAKKEAVYNPSFYVMSHFSRFIRPGAVRLELTDIPEGLDAVVYRNPDQSLVYTIYNSSDHERGITIKNGSESLELALKGASLTTVIIRN